MNQSIFQTRRIVKNLLQMMTIYSPSHVQELYLSEKDR